VEKTYIELQPNPSMWRTRTFWPRFWLGSANSWSAELI